MCVTAQMSVDLGGAEGKAVFIDTEGNFRPERIVSIARRFGLDEEETLANIIHARAYTHEQQMTLAKMVAALCVEQGPIKLLVIDSMMSLFRVDFTGRGDLAERQQKLGKHLAALTQIAEEFNIAVIYTNQAREHW